MENIEMKELNNNLDEFLEGLENEIDGASEAIKATRLGNQLARVSRGENFLEFKLIMSYGDKNQAKSLFFDRNY